MRLPSTVPAQFLARPNRFLVLAESRGAVVRCFCPSPGRLGELLVPGAALRIAPAARPGRSTTHDLLLVRHGGVWVGVDTRLAPAVFREAVEASRLPGLRGALRAEPRVAGGRLDFRVGDAWVEVKAVNLVRDGTALFPDAPSARAARHAEALARLARRGERAVMGFVVLRPDARAFAVNEAADPAFARALARAARAGVEVRDGSRPRPAPCAPRVGAGFDDERRAWNLRAAGARCQQNREVGARRGRPGSARVLLRVPHPVPVLLAAGLLLVGGAVLPLALGGSRAPLAPPSPGEAWITGHGGMGDVLSTGAAAKRGGAVPAAAGGPTFAAPVELPDSEAFGEPSIAAAPDGTLYIVAPGTGTWRSDDRGGSWRRVANTLGEGGDSDIAVDADGVVYGSDLADNSPVSVSFDRAESYAYSTVTNEHGGDREWIAVAGSGNVYAIVGANGGPEFSMSHDQGQTFSEPIRPVGDASLASGILAASTSDLYFPYPDNGVALAISHDGGATWTSRHVADLAGGDCGFNAVGRDAAGTLYVTWCDLGLLGTPAYGTSRVYVAASKDDGATWGPRVQLSDDPLYNTFPWIAAGDAGRVMVAWYEGVPLVPSWPDRDHELALADWHVAVAWSFDADQPTPAWERMAVTGVTHTGPICHVGCGGLLDFFEITAMPGGDLAIAYAGGDELLPSLPGLGQGAGTSQARLFAVVQNGGPNLHGGG